MKPEINPQLVYLDPLLVDRARLSRGLSHQKVVSECVPANGGAAGATLDYRTYRRIAGRQGLFPESAKLIANALGRDVLDLLAPWDPRYVAPPEARPWHGETEWLTTGYLDQGRLAPNGLYYLVCRLEHRYTASRLGRGKFYHLSWLRTGILEETRHQLSRHADVCARLSWHPQIAHNLTSQPTAGQEGWWVVDDWVGEFTLADRLAAGPWPPAALPRLLHEIAVGLSALHAAGVIFRELAPARVLLAEADGRAVLTDFELAKLLDGVPSVSGDWPDDPFRAPELDGGPTTVAADLYSFGRLAAAALVGTVPDSGQEAAVFAQARLPKRLQKLLVQAVAPFPAQRLSELPPLLHELSRWAEA